ncbi:hypothetical protein DFJ77DRAFT_248868 [Powellomyces hirtus]|nr:hypothetical protein DFJ77DRAFT_248868 [Powellomyces hirtus]
MFVFVGILAERRDDEISLWLLLLLLPGIGITYVELRVFFLGSPGSVHVLAKWLKYSSALRTVNCTIMLLAIVLLAFVSIYGAKAIHVDKMIQTNDMMAGRVLEGWAVLSLAVNLPIWPSMCCPACVARYSARLKKVLVKVESPV